MRVKLFCAAILVAGLAYFLFGAQALFAMRRAGEAVPMERWAMLGAAALVNTVCGWMLIRQPDVNAKARALKAKQRAAEIKARRVGAAASNLEQLQD
jgi:hypothetical protein